MTKKITIRHGCPSVNLENFYSTISYEYLGTAASGKFLSFSSEVFLKGFKLSQKTSKNTFSYKRAD